VPGEDEDEAVEAGPEGGAETPEDSGATDPYDDTGSEDAAGD